ncbi:hypothetical protein F991_00349 [Acinetobacter sp. CIP-A165]|uniref:DMT family transporter n=1 Tax=Acinetobacter sp. CIP-A165 TaxID=40373 RepID=UPI0002CFF5DC|nr:DMT family transporter [Acinetobacter sp. CIP-A165]ENU31585.1 hypothetical protein F991_00349 [Acinetobacter sp. CIP-A165]
MTVRTQGYVFVFITMCIWGGFTIFSRLNAHWHISAWDLVAMRFAIAFTILMPILIYKKDLAFLWHPRAVILALTGGLAYCFTVYTAFLHAPAAHAAIFLNGFIPLCTAVAAYVFFKQTFDKHTWLSLIIMLSALAVMNYLMLHEQASSFGLGDLLFFFSAVWWGLFTVLLKQWQLSAWHAMASVAIWSALIYLPIYLLFIPKHFQEVEAVHLLVQGLFHGVLVVIVATLTYIAAIQRLGAFKTGSIVTLAPFIAAVLAVPLLNEPLSVAVACGLVGMAIGALQPWRWFRQDSLSKQLAQQKKD